MGATGVITLRAVVTPSLLTFTAVCAGHTLDCQSSSNGNVSSHASSFAAVYAGSAGNDRVDVYRHLHTAPVERWSR
jgi:hypothetical protein